MIDLAGSESLTSADPVRIAETQHINKSLGSIADVIGAISSKQVELALTIMCLILSDTRLRSESHSFSQFEAYLLPAIESRRPRRVAVAFPPCMFLTPDYPQQANA